MPSMEPRGAITVPLQISADRTGPGSPIKVERESSIPPLIEDTPGIRENGDIDEQQNALYSMHSKLQLPNFEYSSLQDRFERLERQHSELQDLATAYSDVIRGFSSADSQAVSISQLQAEAGHDGLRVRALEADVLRPLVRDAGGLQALVVQTHTMRSLIDKAGGLQELEQFVSDLPTIRDILDDFRGSQGLAGSVAEVQDLLKNEKEYAGLKFQVDGPNGLRAKAARYEKLMQAFADVQTNTAPQCQRPVVSKADSIQPTADIFESSSRMYEHFVKRQQTLASSTNMNPARARLIAATPLEVDPNRDLYEAAPPVTKLINKTGSNNTPLGPPQAQYVAQPVKNSTKSSTLKRKNLENPTPNVPTKYSRFDLAQASALAQVSLTGTADHSVEQVMSQTNIMGARFGTAVLTPQIRTSRVDTKGVWVKNPGHLPHIQTSMDPSQRSKWTCADAQLGYVGFASTSGARMSTYAPTPQSQALESYDDTRPVSLLSTINNPNYASQFSEMKLGSGHAGQSVYKQQ